MAPQHVARWSAFEEVVAAFYRAFGAQRVQQNANLAGNEIDVLVEELTASGAIVRTAVECKFYAGRVPKSAVIQFASVAKFLRELRQIDRAVMVSYRGFSAEAQQAAQTAGIELQDFADLEAKVAPLLHSPIVNIVEEAERTPLPEAFPDLVFVIMPFAEEYEDIYLYGIRGAAERCGLKCSRADEIEHDRVIIEEVTDHIRRAKIVVAEVSTHNPNVFYETGWAHALGKPTILVANNKSELPFDIRHINTILYKNIKDLEERLTVRMKSLNDAR